MDENGLNIAEQMRELRRELDTKLGDRDLSGSVLAHLQIARPHSHSTLGPRLHIRWRVAVASVLALAGGALAIPPARAAIADFMRFGAAHLHREEPPPNRRHPVQVGLPDLGTKSTIA